MKKIWWLVVFALMIIPQRISAQSTRQKLFDIEGSVFNFEWSPDNRWLTAINHSEDAQYFDFETRRLYSEEPAYLKHELSAEERVNLHVADDATIHISPDGRYVLYDSSDPIVIPDSWSEEDREQYEILRENQIYLADRQTRKYVLWTNASGLGPTWWSPDSSGALIWRGIWEGSALAGYVTDFREDVTKSRDVYVSSFIAQGKDYYHFDAEDGIYAISRDGRKILMTARDTATGMQNVPVMRSLIYFDLNDASKHRIIEYDTAEAFLSYSYSENPIIIGGAGFGTDVDRYVWVLSSRGLLLHDLQSGLTRVMDASLTTEVSQIGVVSPDGKWMAYAIYDDPHYQSTVYLVDLEQLMK